MNTAVLRRAIARRRRSGLVRFAHRVAGLFEEAYQNVGAEASWNGEFDLLARLAPADLHTVLDVGANLGDWAFEALRHWPSSVVHAFEIAPPTAAALASRIAETGVASRLTLNRIGLGSTDTNVEIHYYPDHPDLTCDRDRFPAYRSETMHAPITTGDHYRAAAGIERIDFLKIDVEGAEMTVLEGFRDTIATGAVRMIQFEYGAFSIDTRVLLQDYYRLLAPQYLMGKIYPGFVDFKDYNWRDESFQFSNYLCVSRQEPALVERAAG